MPPGPDLTVFKPNRFQAKRQPWAGVAAPSPDCCWQASSYSYVYLFPLLPSGYPNRWAPFYGIPKGQVLATGQLGSIDGGRICE